MEKPNFQRETEKSNRAAVRGVPSAAAAACLLRALLPLMYWST